MIIFFIFSYFNKRTLNFIIKRLFEIIISIFSLSFFNLKLDADGLETFSKNVILGLTFVKYLYEYYL